jgi:hydrogenase nickel incorporation protein HypB
MRQHQSSGDATLAITASDELAESNRLAAARNRERFSREGVLCVNVMGAPGSGKTSLLEATARTFGKGRLAAIVGEQATETDAGRLRLAGFRSATLNSGSSCHLDARAVHSALGEIDLDGVDYLFIENVGSLVCPADYDLGQAVDVIALSVTEGEDKPLKYPRIFEEADLVVLTKSDLITALPGVTFDRYESSLRRIMRRPSFIMMAANNGFGISRWLDWLQRQRMQTLGAVDAAVAGESRGMRLDRGSRQ